MSKLSTHAVARQVYARYHAIVPDWDAFLESLSRPLATTVWAHSWRIGRERLRPLLAEAGIETTPVPWHPQALRMPEGVGAGAHWGHAAGLYQPQEEVAMVPVMLLDPQPGERVLDMCAAPGNKTAQIAVAMNNTGTVHANEVQKGRLAALRRTVKRLGLANVTVTLAPGQDLSLRNGPFDRVLVDAPCSGEGIWRKGRGERGQRALQIADDAMRERLAHRQRQLLTRAVRLAAVGARIVYSTCTIAPEENEAVVDAVLRAFPGRLRVRVARLPGVDASPGVTEWAGMAYDDAVADTARVWPHQNDTGGFYVAVLEKVDGAETHGDHAPPPVADSSELAALAERFGLPEAATQGLTAVAGSGRYLQLASADHRLPAELEVQSTGLPVVGLQARPPKPTTAAAMALGAQATRNCLDLDTDELAAFMRREPLTRTPGALGRIGSRGYVLVRHRGFGIGVACTRGALDRPEVALASLYPKAWGV